MVVPVSQPRSSSLDSAERPAGAGRLWRFCIVGLLAVLSVCASAEPSREYQLKAAFIYNFAQFVEWPSDTFAGSDVPLVIGIVGDDPFDGSLEQTLNGKTAGGHSLKVTKLGSNPKEEDLRACNILFVAGGADSDRTLQAVRGSAVLTVGESEAVVSAGGVIRLYVEGNKIRFEISPKAAKAAKLNVSAKLLKLAKIYER